MMPALKRRVRITLFLACTYLVSVSTGHAEDLADLIPSLIPSGITLPGPPISHDPSVFENNPRTAALAEGINSAIFSQLPAYPLGSSSGGFTYAFDSEAGVVKRDSKTFGPLFAERALTLGKNKWNVGWIYTSAGYDDLDGIPLGGGNLVFDYFHDGVTTDANGYPLYPNNEYQSDVIQSQLSLDIRIDSSILYANYGVLKNLDIGLAVPVIRTSIDGTAVQTILPFGNTSTVNCPTVPFGQNCHQFAPGILTRTITTSGSASGLGDIVVRAKYGFWKNGPGGLALGTDVRVPTGDEDNLLGTGTTALKLFLIGSTEYGAISPHVNLGYTFVFGSSPTSGDIPDETNYVAGIDFAASPHFTFNADFVGRIMRNSQRVESSTRLWSYAPANPVTGQPTSALLDESLPYTGTVSTLDGAFGLRAAVYERLLLSGSIIVPLLQNQGIQDNLRFALALEYSF